jgi:hypothetical protein
LAKVVPAYVEVVASQHKVFVLHDFSQQSETHAHQRIGVETACIGGELPPTELCSSNPSVIASTAPRKRTCCCDSPVCPSTNPKALCRLRLGYFKSPPILRRRASCGGSSERRERLAARRWESSKDIPCILRMMAEWESEYVWPAATYRDNTSTA